MPGVSSRLEFRTLGPLEVALDERSLELGGYRQRALLAVLLLRANEVVSTDRLIEDVWGESAPPSATNMVQVYVSRLRKALGRDLLVTRPPGYVVLVEEAQVDALRFASVVRRARDALADGRAESARALLEEAMRLWRGPPLADFTYEPFAQPEVARLEELRTEAIELRVDADLALGRHAQLVGELEALIAAHPFRERLRSQLMLALYQGGRQAEALEAYRAARTTLVEELGIEPSPALQALERAILAQDVELLAPTTMPASADAGVKGVVRKGNVPPELTSLIGRDGDVERIADLVAHNRFTAVVGPGGVGKTRVAQRVARIAADGFEHGVWFVDLGALDPGGDVSGAVLSTVGIADRPGAAALDTVAADLRERRLLLVLDNCEHVLGAAAELGERLLRDCPGVRILATSREPLAIAGERVERLEPLPTTTAGSEPPAAVQLFLDRAAAHGVPLRENAEVLGTIQEICARLDGLPLAIELAAGRTRAISPAGLLAHLGDRMRLLTRPGHRAGPTRQQTLEAAITWSYDLLNTEEQATLRRLSVFHGGFPLAAAFAVCADVGGELDTLDRVTNLVDRSVITMRHDDDRDRYRLLESIAVFAEALLHELGEAKPARDRHARFFLEFVQEESDRLDRAEQASRAKQLDGEQDNLTAALRWCLEGDGDATVGAALAADLGQHWLLRGRLNTAKRWLDRALQLGDDIAPTSVAAVNVAYSGLAFSMSDFARSRICATEAVAIARQIDDQDLLSEALAQLACSYHGVGSGADATRAAAELRSLEPHLSVPRAQIMANLARAQVAFFTGDLEQAGAAASRACEIARRVGDHLRASWSGFWLAYTLALTSATASARAAIADAGQDAIRSGYELAVVDNLIAATTIALADDDPETVLRLLPKVVATLRDQQRWGDLGGRLYVAAAAELKLGLPQRAAILLGAAERWTDHIDVDAGMILPELAGMADQLSARLGTKGFAHDHDRGGSLSVEDVISLISAPD